MSDGSRTIRVDVERDVLAALPGSPRTKQEYRQRLALYRRQFGQIATAKYEEGEFETEVRVAVVRIGKNDIV